MCSARKGGSSVEAVQTFYYLLFIFVFSLIPTDLTASIASCQSLDPTERAEIMCYILMK